MLNIKKSFGRKIKQIRKEHKLTQEKLAELIGIEIPSLSNIETGKFAPSVETLQKLCEVFGVEPWELYSFNTINDEQMFNYINNKIQDNKKLHLVYNFLKTID